MRTVALRYGHSSCFFFSCIVVVVLVRAFLYRTSLLGAIKVFESWRHKRSVLLVLESLTKKQNAQTMYLSREEKQRVEKQRVEKLRVEIYS